MSDELRFTQGDATWTAMRERGKTDLYYFAGVICRYGDVVGMTDGMHKLMCKVVERKTGVEAIDSKPFQSILMPRGSGKSTLVTQARTLQLLCQDPTASIMIANENLTNATLFLGAIKYQIEQNDLFRALFPELIPDNFDSTMWATEQIKVKGHSGRKEPSIFCVGVGGTKTGMHPDHIFVDDMLSREAAENARRGDGGLTRATNRWISQLKPLLNAGYQPMPTITVIGTRWFLGDSYEELPRIFGYGESPKTWTLGCKLPTGETQSVPVTVTGDLVQFTRRALENGRPTWPERPGFDLDGLAKQRISDPELFAANMMNEPSDELTATFKDSWLGFYEWQGTDALVYNTDDGKPQSLFLADLDIVFLVDPGGFSNRAEDRMRGAIIVTGSTLGSAPKHLILDAFSDKVTYMGLIDQIAAFASRYTPRRIGIEESGQQAAFIELVKRELQRRGIMAPIEAVKPRSKVKEARILGLEPFFQRGMILVGRGAAFHEFRDQYRTFPKSTRVDLMDALAYGPILWRKGNLTGQSQEARQAMEKRQYMERRGVALRR